MSASILKIREVVISAAYILFVVGCFLLWLECQERLSNGRATLRESHVHMQQLERQQFHLKDARKSQWLAELEGGLTYLKISIDEFMNEQVDESSAIVSHYEFSETENHSSVIGQISVATLRVTFDVLLPHAVALSDFYFSLVDSATPWLGEIRGCEIDREAAHGLPRSRI